MVVDITTPISSYTVIPILNIEHFCQNLVRNCLVSRQIAKQLLHNDLSIVKFSEIFAWVSSCHTYFENINSLQYVSKHLSH